VVAKAIGAGRAIAVETVDFNDPQRPKTCLEVDFPILPLPTRASGWPRPSRANALVQTVTVDRGRRRLACSNSRPRLSMAMLPSAQSRRDREH
jgi:hypothetical protein